MVAYGVGMSYNFQLIIRLFRMYITEAEVVYQMLFAHVIYVTIEELPEEIFITRIKLQIHLSICGSSLFVTSSKMALSNNAVNLSYLWQDWRSGSNV